MNKFVSFRSIQNQRIFLEYILGMKVFLSENKGHFHVLKSHGTFKHVCAEANLVPRAQVSFGQRQDTA